MRGKSTLNNTAALVSRGPDGGEEHSISVRKIENGFLTRQSSYNPGTGECHSSETFSKSRPEIRPPRVRGGAGELADSRNAMADANKELRNR